MRPEPHRQAAQCHDNDQRDGQGGTQAAVLQDQRDCPDEDCQAEERATEPVPRQRAPTTNSAAITTAVVRAIRVAFERRAVSGAGPSADGVSTQSAP